MNKFINEPDSVVGMVGLVCWIGILAGLMALLFSTLSRITGV